MSRRDLRTTGEEVFLSDLEKSMTGKPVMGSIEDQEARGQQDLCSEVLSRIPSEMMHFPGTTMYDGGVLKREILADMGIAVGERIKGDEMWSEATFPDGWRMIPTEHSMWSDIVDADGVKRLSVFYKAAFYDRSCHVSLYRPECPACIDWEYEEKHGERDYQRCVLGVVVYTKQPKECETCGVTRFDPTHPNAKHYAAENEA